MTAEKISVLLEEARNAWSLDVATLSARAHLEPEATEAALRGVADVSDLAAVAGALGGTLDDLMVGRRFWEAPATAFKNAPSSFELPLVRAALLRLSSVARDRAMLAELVGIMEPSPSGTRPFDPVPLAEDVTAQAETLAAQVRAVLGNENEPIASIRDAMRRLGVATFLTDVGTKDVDGMTWRDDRNVLASAVNVRARGGKLTAVRMTFAHELCHGLFDGTKLSHFGIVEHRTELSERLEQRANAFSAHFLAPRSAVLRVLRERGLRAGEKPSAVHVRILSEHFLMGVEAVAHHLITCGLWSKLDVMRHRDLVTRSAIGEDNAELYPTQAEANLALERRGELLELASLALERGEISVGRWREALGVRASDEWRALLAEQQISGDVEQRSDV